MKRQTVFLSIALVLFLVGGTFLEKGGKILYDDLSRNLSQQLEEEIEEFQLGTLTSVTLWPTKDFKETAPVENIKINFDTLVVFAGDEIGYKAEAKVTNPEIIGVALMVVSPSEHFEGITGPDAYQEVLDARPYGQVIELSVKSEPPFITSGKIPFLQANANIALHGFVFKENETFEQIDTSGTIFTVYPTVARLEAVTNQAVLKQIQQENISSKIQNRQTNVIIGLAWIAIAWMPLVIAADILIRLYIRPGPNLIERIRMNKS